MVHIALVVLATLVVLCAVLGAIYAYIYYTKIVPRTQRTRSFIAAEPPQVADDDAAHGSTSQNSTTATSSTHVFLFRKS